MTWLEHLAVLFLERRGHMVLPRSFVGVVFGYATVVREKIGDVTVYESFLPRGHKLIALNHTVVSNKEPRA